MKILGISGSPRSNEQSSVYKLVKVVLENSGLSYELVSLRNLKINGCIACLGCVKDNICKVDDDLAPLREKFVEADAYVIGAPNYYSTINVITHALLERWFQFRHQAGDTLWGKLAVTVGVGGTSGQFPANELEKFLLYNFIETVDKVHGQGAASCYSCGFGESCPVGIPHMLYGPEVKITDDMIPHVSKQPEVITAAATAGKMLAKRLQSGHDRTKVTQNMQQKMLAMFESSV